jgi:hypothetical protein
LVARVIEEHATIGLGILDRLKDQIEAGKTEALSSENSEKYWRDQVAPTIDQLIGTYNQSGETVAIEPESKRKTERTVPERYLDVEVYRNDWNAKARSEHAREFALNQKGGSTLRGGDYVTAFFGPDESISPEDRKSIMKSFGRSLSTLVTEGRLGKKGKKSEWIVINGEWKFMHEFSQEDRVRDINAAADLLSSDQGDFTARDVYGILDLGSGPPNREVSSSITMALRQRLGKDFTYTSPDAADAPGTYTLIKK